MTVQPGSPDAPAPVSGAGSPPDAVTPILPSVPVGPVRWWSAGFTVTAATLMVLAAYAGTAVLVAAVLLIVLGVAWGWPDLLDLPSPRGSALVIAVSGAGAAVAVALTENEPLLQWLAPALAGAVVLEFLHELTRRDGRPRLVESLTGTMLAVVVLASLSALVALPHTVVGASGVVVAVVPVAVGMALLALPAPARLLSAGAVVVATLIGGLLGGLMDGPTVGVGLVVGGLSSVVAILLHRLTLVLPTAGYAPAWFAVALVPLASSGMVAYVVLRLMVG